MRGSMTICLRKYVIWSDRSPNRSMMSWKLRSFSAAVLATAGMRGGSVEFDALNPAVLQERLEMVSRKMPERQATLERLFAGAGCSGENFTTQPVREIGRASCRERG